VLGAVLVDGAIGVRSWPGLHDPAHGSPAKPIDRLEGTERHRRRVIPANNGLTMRRVLEKFPAIARVAVEENGSRVILDSWRSCWSGLQGFGG
jgi:hypothetical protein